MLVKTSLGSASTQRGLSLVELMVGIAVGLVILAAASIMVVSQLTDNRRLLLETQVQQDLRITADIIVRDLRRAGHAGLEWPNAVWAGRVTGGSLPNNYSAVSTPAETVTFAYRDPNSTPRAAGYRRDGDAIQSRIGTSWQDLTDRVSLKVTRFDVTVRSAGVGGRLPCPRLCADTSTVATATACWPTYTVRELDFVIVAEAVHDKNVKHTIRRTVKLRNDDVAFLVPNGSFPNLACPQ